jgi:hypothetical protein
MGKAVALCIAATKQDSGAKPSIRRTSRYRTTPTSIGLAGWPYGLVLSHSALAFDNHSL